MKAQIKSLVTKLPPSLYLKLRRMQVKRRAPDKFNRNQERRNITTDSGYSLKPFDDTKSIFIHIPKCAGVSINKELYGNLAGGHMRLTQYIDVFEPENILNYFKFTIVRNPWDRLVSAYFFLKRGGFGPIDQQWFESELAGFADFEEFVKGWVTKENVASWYHFHPQHFYFKDPAGKVAVDFIGYFENLDEDFSVIAKKVGVNGSLSKTNQGHHNNYQSYYTEETKEIVAQAYAEDIHYLGYSFDNANLNHQVKTRSPQ